MPQAMYEQNLPRLPANFTALTPLDYLRRSAETYPVHTAVIHGADRMTYRQLYARARRLASALAAAGIGAGDTVAVIAPNIPAHLEAHFGVPMIGAVINGINTRLDARTIAFILDHGEAKVLLTDAEYAAVVGEALSLCTSKPMVIDIVDPLGPAGARLGAVDYEAFIAAGDPEFPWAAPADEWQAIALNYTSGTTGNPKGVVYHHRGAALNAIGNVLAWGMTLHPVYLWTLPMFHCNGWCFPWTITAMAGIHVCLRRFDAATIFDAIRAHGISHMCGAPTVLNMMVNAPHDQKVGLPHGVRVMTAGAAPPAAVIGAMEAMTFHVTHTYGLTEVYGPAVVCAWHEDWNDLPPAERATLRARQGVRYHVLDGLTVMDPATMTPVPADGATLGEVMFRGNVVM